MKNNINVIIVNDFSYVDGGASKVAIESAIGLKKIGYGVIFFSAVKPISQELVDNNINVISTGQFDILKDNNRLRSIIQGIWNIKAEKAIESLLEKYSPKNTIVHVHSWEKALSTSCIKIINKMKFKMVITLHNYEIVCPNGGLFNYNSNKICYLKPMSVKCILCNCDSRKYVHKIWRVLRQNKQIKKGLLPSGVNNYIYISEMSKNILKPFLPTNASFYYVKNPIDIKKNESVNVMKNNSFVYVGRLSKEKGCLLFAEAAKDLNIDAIFVGDGELKDRIKKVYPKSRITGWLDKSQVEYELNYARALVFPSLWYETLGLTALEAQAKGVPVIVSDACTAREFIKDKITGLWFKSGDLEDLKEKIKMMMDNNLVKIYGQNSYVNYWENDFSPENHISQLEKVYEDILK